MYEDTSI